MSREDTTDHQPSLEKFYTFYSNLVCHCLDLEMVLIINSECHQPIRVSSFVFLLKVVSKESDFTMTERSKLLTKAKNVRFESKKHSEQKISFFLLSLTLYMLSEAENIKVIKNK